MLSLRAICLVLLLAPLLAFADATPTLQEAGPKPNPAKPSESSKPAASAASKGEPGVSKPVGSEELVLPHTGKAELPSTSLTLKYVTIGQGVQNYTCTSANARPKSFGAIATLFDATALAHKSLEDLHALPGKLVGGGKPDLPRLGHHFFDAAGTPIFNLDAAEPKAILFATKALNVSAPVPNAVDWLFLKSKPGYTSVGLSAAYRVETAGGKTTCKKQGTESVAYAAEYWFYA